MNKKYNSVTVLKGIACIMVFMSHWYDTFYGWGCQTLDHIIKIFPFSLLYNGNLAVCLFMVLSGFLFSLKIYKNKGGNISWSEVVLKRYFRLTVPIVTLSVIALVFSRAGLFYNIPASKILQNEWLSWYYNTDLTWKALLSTSFVKTLTVGDSLFYGPLWMMKYMFWGSFFCIIICKVLLELNKKGKIAFIGCLFTALFILNSYYICFLLGALLALWSASNFNSHYTAVSVGCFFSGLVCVKLGQILPSYFLTREYPAMLSQYYFYNMLGAFGIMGGSYLLVDKIFMWEDSKAVAPFIWIGKRSFSIFFTHWIIICSFSSWFYIKMYSYGMPVAIGVNFLLTSSIIVFMSSLFYNLIENKLSQNIWRKIKHFFVIEFEVL